MDVSNSSSSRVGSKTACMVRVAVVSMAMVSMAMVSMAMVSIAMVSMAMVSMAVVNAACTVEISMRKYKSSYRGDN